MSARARLTILAAVWLAFVVPSDDAHAGPRDARVCAHRATLYESPGGAAVGVVRRGDVVRVLRRGSGDRWWRVRARFGTRGWIRRAFICREDR